MDETLCEGRHGLKHLLFRGLGTSTCDKPPGAPPAVLYQLGENQLHVAYRAALGPCSILEPVCGAAGSEDEKVPGGGAERTDTTGEAAVLFLPQSTHLFPRLCTHEAAFANLSRGSLFFCCAQWCHIGQSNPRWSGRFEKWQEGTPQGLFSAHAPCTRRSQPQNTAFQGRY